MENSSQSFHAIITHILAFIKPIFSECIFSILFYSFPSLSLSLPFSSSFFFFLECSLSSLCLWKPSTLSNCFWEGCTQQLAESCDNFKVIEQHCFLLLFHHPHPHSQSHFFFSSHLVSLFSHGRYHNSVFIPVSQHWTVGTVHAWHSNDRDKKLRYMSRINSRLQTDEWLFKKDTQTEQQQERKK